MFNFRKPKSDIYGIAPYAPREHRDHIDADPVTIALACKVTASQRSTPYSAPDRGLPHIPFSLSGPFYET